MSQHKAAYAISYHGILSHHVVHYHGMPICYIYSWLHQPNTGNVKATNTPMG